MNDHALNSETTKVAIFYNHFDQKLDIRVTNADKKTITIQFRIINPIVE